MSEVVIDVNATLIALSAHLSDDAKREEIVARISEQTGISHEDVRAILYAARDTLAEYLPTQ